MKNFRKFILTGTITLLALALPALPAFAEVVPMSASGGMRTPISITITFQIDFGIVTIPQTTGSCVKYSLTGTGGDDAPFGIILNQEGATTACGNVSPTPTVVATDGAFLGAVSLAVFTVTYDPSASTGFDIDILSLTCNDLDTAILTIIAPPPNLVLTGGTGVVFLNAELEVPAGVASTDNIDCTFFLFVNY